MQMSHDSYGGADDGLEGGQPFAEINVTPLVDVMLVLLVVFMMAAPLMVQGVAVDLPKGAGKPLGQPSKPILVSLARDGSLYLRDEKVPFETLGARIEALHASVGDSVVYVRADRGIAYGNVMDVIGRFGAGGFTHVSLLSLPLPAAQAP